MSGGAFCGLAAFDSLNDGVLRAAGRDAKSVAGDSDGLMMAGIDGKAKEVILLGGLFASQKLPRSDSGAVAAVCAMATLLPAE